MRISDWSSDVCSSDLAGESTSFTLTITNDGPAVIASGEVISLGERPGEGVSITGYEVTAGAATLAGTGTSATLTTSDVLAVGGTIVVKVTATVDADAGRSEEHTSELQSLMRITYAVFCLKKKKTSS